ncbi:MAG: membrane protein insertase YidC [Chloroflexota bacterium]|nr:MAG: membrane protein insertase YidC [Chloroflexota bacterium]
MALWDQFVVQAVFVRGLEFLYQTLASFNVPSWGVAIIVFTFIVKSVTLPLTLRSVRSMKRMQEVQPKLQALQRQHKNDKERLMQEQMALYKEHGVNPVAGCLPMLIQMPVWIALYSALFYLANNNPDFAKPFLWIANLGKPEFAVENFPRELPILAVLTGVTQWMTTKMAQQPSADPQQQSMNQVMQFMPLMFIFFSLSVPAGLVLYWVASNLYQMVQQYFITGWGMLIPVGVPAPGSDRATRDARQSAPAKDIDLQDTEAVRTPSNSGRRRRNKRR